ncbi:TetR/AcrR family transcriptional regulator [Streptomyces sp. NPDC017448]|uniref:TetR/AcrR family transcriptional regulator n=1 Tax=Streptomyces sp. NPDC017448 TaxID=3364996 RepID=UPI0037ABC594
MARIVDMVSKRAGPPRADGSGRTVSIVMIAEFRQVPPPLSPRPRAKVRSAPVPAAEAAVGVTPCPAMADRSVMRQGDHDVAGRADPAVRRELILKAAVRVFARPGFAATRVDDIAAEAGVAKGSVYLHSDSRDALPTAAFEEYRAPLTDGEPAGPHRPGRRTGAVGARHGRGRARTRPYPHRPVGRPTAGGRLRDGRLGRVPGVPRGRRRAARRRRGRGGL